MYSKVDQINSYTYTTDKQCTLDVLFFQQRPCLLHNSAACISICILYVEKFQKITSLRPILISIGENPPEVSGQEEGKKKGYSIP